MDPGFQVSGGRTEKNCAERREAQKFVGYFVWKITILRQKIIFFSIADGGAKIFGVFCVKNHDYTPKNHIFSDCGRRRENFWGISCEKSPKKSYFFQLRTEARKFLGYFVWKITILRQKIIFFPIADGGAKIFGVFRVKNHDFTPKNHISSNFRGGPDPPLIVIDNHFAAF